MHFQTESINAINHINGLDGKLGKDKRIDNPLSLNHSVLSLNNKMSPYLQPETRNNDYMLPLDSVRQNQIISEQCDNIQFNSGQDAEATAHRHNLMNQTNKELLFKNKIDYGDVDNILQSVNNLSPKREEFEMDGFQFDEHIEYQYKELNQFIKVESEQQIVQPSKKDVNMKKMVSYKRQCTTSLFPIVIEPQPTYIVFGEKYFYAEKSLNLLSQENLIRKLCLFIITSKFFGLFNLFMNLLYIAADIIYDYRYRIFQEKEFDITNNLASKQIQIVCDAFFICETIMNILQAGLVEGRHSYIKNSYNILNLLAIIGSVGQRIVSDDLSPYFFPLKVLRIIRIMYFFPILKNRLNSLISTLPELYKIVLGLFAIMTIYALIGLHIFQGALEFRCRFESEPTPDGIFQADKSQMNLCGSQSGCNEGTYCRAPFQYDVPFHPDEANIESLNYGFTKFDHFGWSLFTVFHIVESIGWSSIMFIHWRFFDTRVCSFFFISLLVFGFYIILNLFLGTLYDGFQTRQTIKSRVIREIKQEKKKEKTTIKNVIGKKKRKTYNEQSQKLLTNNSSQALNILIKHAMDRIHSNNIPVKYKIYNFQSIKYYGYSFQTMLKNMGFLKCFYESGYFHLFSYTIIIANYIVLCCDQYPIKESLQKNLILADAILTIFFLIEVVIRIFSQKRAFFKNLIDLADFAILTANIIMFIVGFAQGQNMFRTETQEQAIIKCMKGWRIFRILLEMTVLYPLSILVEAFFKTFKGLFYHTIIVAIFILAFSILGMNLFAYRARFIQDIKIPQDPLQGKPYIFNFDTFGNSIIAVILCFLNEEWHLIMYHYMHAVGNIALLFFVIVICIGEITLMRLFLAIYIQNYLIILKKKEIIAFEDEGDLQVKIESLEMLPPEKKKEVIEKSQEQQLAPYTIDNNQRIQQNLTVNSNISNIEIQLQKNQQHINCIDKNNEQPRRSLTQKNKSEKYEEKNNFLDQLNVIQSNRIRQKSEDRNLLKIDISKQKNGYASQPNQNIKSLSVLSNDNFKEPSPIQLNNNLYLSKESIYKENTAKKQNSILAFKSDNASQKIAICVQKEKAQQHLYDKKGSILHSQKSLKERSVLSQKFILYNIFILYRFKLQQFLKSKYFENSIIFLIVLSCIILGISDPLKDPNSTTQKTIRYLDIIIIIIFIIEGVLKMIAYGIYNKNSDSYLKNGWNIIDLTSIIISLGVFFFSYQMRFMNGFRAIRIVKISQRMDSVKIALISIIKSIPTVAKLSLLAFASLTFFALFPLKYFKGKYYMCANSSVLGISTKWDCMDTGGDWVPQDLRWDNIIRSTYNIFIISTCEGWSFMMQQAYNATNVQIHSIPGLSTQSKDWSVYFVFTFVVGNKMIFNSFIGVLIEKFTQIKNFYSPYRGLKGEEKEWAIIKEGIIKSKPKKALSTKQLGPFRRQLHKLIHKNKHFKRFDDFCTIANTVVFMLYFHRMEEQFKTILDYINMGFLIVFGIQLALKISLYSNKFFSKSVWNCFEVFLFLFSLVGLFLKFYLKTDSYEINALFNFMQVIRSCRIVLVFNSAVELLSTITLVLPSVGPIAIFFCFVLFIWTLIGLNLFPYLKPQVYINGFDLSFRDFTSTVATLIRVAQSEFWFGLVVDAGREQQPNFVCYNVSSYAEFEIHGFTGCGHELSAFIYFFSFHLIVSIMIVNLLLALIIDGSAEAFKIKDAALNRYQLDQIQDLWMEYDKDGQGFINYKDFWQFSSRISIIYGVKQEDLLDINHKKDFLKVLQIPIYELQQRDSHGQNISQFGYIYHDVIIKLTAISVILKYGASDSINDESSIKDTTLLKVPAYSKVVPTQLFSGDMSSIILMQRKIKKWVQRHQQIQFESQKMSKSRSEKLMNDLNFLSGDEDILSFEGQVLKKFEIAFQDKSNSTLTKNKEFVNPATSKIDGKPIQELEIKNSHNYLKSNEEISNQSQQIKLDQKDDSISQIQEPTQKNKINVHANIEQQISLKGDNDEGVQEEIKI
ncbi:hypothetical protein ABPG72_001220 [Tetrahymena utriculariae]